MQDAPSFRAVHDGLLDRYARLTSHIGTPKHRRMLLRKMTTSYLPGASTYAALFQAETSLPSETQSEEMLKDVYHAWRRSDPVRATLTWAAWLLGRGRGKEAADAVQTARAQAGQHRQALDDEWRKVLQTFEPAGTRGEHEDSDVEMHEEP